jgi:hypothetical protein
MERDEDLLTFSVRLRLPEFDLRRAMFNLLDYWKSA